MSDLSEAFAEINAQRMGDAVRKNTRQNATPRMFPSSARIGRLGSPDVEADDVVAVGPGSPKQNSPPSPVPLTPKMKVDIIMEHIKELGYIHDLLHPEERSIIRQSISSYSTSGVLFTRPMECMLGSAIVFTLVGVVIGMMIKNQNGYESVFRSTTNDFTVQSNPSSTSKRTVDRMLDYV